MEHECTVCIQRMTEHQGRCDHDACYAEGTWHSPPLCCPGCRCRSYEEAHLPWPSDPEQWRVLTVRQPWAWAIRPGGKNIENRSGSMATRRWRGPLLIHAGAAWSERGRNDQRVRQLAEQGGSYSYDGRGNQPLYGLKHRPLASHDRPPRPFDSSAVVAVAWLADVHLASDLCASVGGACAPWGEFAYQRADGTLEQNVAHMVLEDATVLPRPVPWRRGRLGLTRPTTELVASVRDELATPPPRPTTWTRPARDGRVVDLCPPCSGDPYCLHCDHRRTEHPTRLCGTFEPRPD